MERENPFLDSFCETTCGLAWRIGLAKDGRMTVGYRHTNDRHVEPYAAVESNKSKSPRGSFFPLGVVRWFACQCRWVEVVLML